VFVSPRCGRPFVGLPGTDEAAADRRERNAAGALSAQFTAWRLDELRRQGLRVVAGSRGHHGPHAERARIVRLVIDSGLEEWRATLLLGHTGDSTAVRQYGASLASTNAHTLRAIIKARVWEQNGTPVPFAVVSRPRRVRREEQEAVERNAALAREVFALFADHDDLNPRQLQQRVAELAERYATPSGGEQPSQ
jgi:hypothetical protein